MKSKYYTPEIEEFYIGFEYEYYNKHSEKWYKHLMDESDWLTDEYGEYNESNPLRNLEGNRVKCLDSEDVESLGFEYGEYSKGRFKNELIELNNVFSNVWTIHAIGDDYRDKLFEGIIKNKSELKKVLTQIGVLEDGKV